MTTETEKSVTVLRVGNKLAAEVIVEALEELFPDHKFSIHRTEAVSGYGIYNIDWHQSQSHRAFNSVRFAAKGAAAALRAPVR